MTTKQTRRQFLTTAAATAAGLPLGGIVKAETPAPVEDIQAVPLGAEYLDPVGGQYLLEDNFDGQPSVGVRVFVGTDWALSFENGSVISSGETFPGWPDGEKPAWLDDNTWHLVTRRRIAATQAPVSTRASGSAGRSDSGDRWAPVPAWRKTMAAEMISFGAGINSVAMMIMLVNDGWRGPIVFADTGGEHAETYCYLEYFGRWLAERGLAIDVLSPATHPELYGKREREMGSLEAFCLMRRIVPLLASRWCSVEWKTGPLDKWRKVHDFPTTLQGICASEPRRIRDDPFVRYPLYEEDITRGECRRIIQRAGLEVPIKSGCFFCPGQRLASWQRLYYDHPELYERAALIEDNAQANDQKWYTLDPHGFSLREHARRRWEGQMEMDLSEWLPCACSL